MTVRCHQSFSSASYATANYVIFYIMLSLSLPYAKVVYSLRVEQGSVLDHVIGFFY
jgi:hypothetical protein